MSTHRSVQLFMMNQKTRQVSSGIPLYIDEIGVPLTCPDTKRGGLAFSEAASHVRSFSAVRFGG